MFIKTVQNCKYEIYYGYFKNAKFAIIDKFALIDRFLQILLLLQTYEILSAYYTDENQK